ncbi:hypothetical protein ACH4ZU_27680 [Streptomyces sp. NPDC020472]|uniref:hypothetical protein n=1 Tax=Streptomyces sp. NPDC020472 TaxID=3365075 RepID=UPI0037A0E770
MAVGVVVPQQRRLIAPGHTAAPVLLGLDSSALHIGVALGGGLGGPAQRWFGLAPAALAPVAAGLLVLALLWHLGTARTPAAPTNHGGGRPGRSGEVRGVTRPASPVRAGALPAPARAAPHLRGLDGRRGPGRAAPGQSSQSSRTRRRGSTAIPGSASQIFVARSAAV